MSLLCKRRDCQYLAMGGRRVYDWQHPVLCVRAQLPVRKLTALTVVLMLYASPVTADTTPAFMTPVRAAVMQQAQALLDAGQADAASDGFERALQMQHEGDAEVGLVRAAMQGGHYRQALNLAAHTASEHADEPNCTALYALLLQVGGQQDLALRVASQALVKAPAAPLLQALIQRLMDTAGLSPAAPLPAASSSLLQPVDLNDAVPSIPATARAIGSAVLLGDGTRALVPLTSIAPTADRSTIFWVRNGLGQARAATLLQRDAATGVALLGLSTPLPSPPTARPGRRLPFPGSPGFTVGYAGQTSHAAWPVLQAGFFGAPRGDGGPWALGIELAPRAWGAAVFDREGRLAGTALPSDGTGSSARFLALKNIPWLIVDNEPPPSQQPAQVASVALVYEHALQLSLQVLASY